MPYHSSNESAFTQWEQSLLAIGCAAVVNRLVHFYLKTCGVWIAAAARQIATKVCSHRIEALQKLAPNHRISNESCA